MEKSHLWSFGLSHLENMVPMSTFEIITIQAPGFSACYKISPCGFLSYKTNGPLTKPNPIHPQTQSTLIYPSPVQLSFDQIFENIQLDGAVDKPQTHPQLYNSNRVKPRSTSSLPPVSLQKQENIIITPLLCHTPPLLHYLSSTKLQTPPLPNTSCQVVKSSFPPKAMEGGDQD